ncbi:class I SAM-dependent methyltransferase [Rhodospirillum sp. A1_3_36]|uniref:class I SAM-dependent methyltransferase n=1 Tax=Rhodospirillum sp. A1_3_36 TaxID=3391666 RepID=UPI0039A502E9
MVEKHLTVTDFADLFGTASTSLPSDIQDRIHARSWRYRPLDREERDKVILGLLQRVERRDFSIVENRDKSRWEKGWAENLCAFEESDGDLAALAPKYWKEGLPLRLWGDFVMPLDPDFEPDWFRIFTQWYFSTYLSGFETILEFGSGSGINVPTLAAMFPETRVVGLDWAQSAVDIVNGLRRHFGDRVEGRPFDFFEPDYDLDILPGSAILTVGAIEQTGTEFAPFLNFLLEKRPSRVVHIEPIIEWYDPGNLVDYTGIRSQEVRNFLKGYPEALNDLERQGRIRILKTKRANFGSIAHEGYSQIIWEPVFSGS